MVIKLEDFKVKKPKEFGFDFNDPKTYPELLRRHHGQTVLEQKFDGHGCIIDNRKGPQVYSLNKNKWNIDVFPEIKAQLQKAKPFFAIGELVGKPTHAGFTNLEEYEAIKRRKLTNYDEAVVGELMKDFPLDLQIYHMLEFAGEDLRKYDLLSMREALEAAVKGLTNVHAVTQQLIQDPSEYREIVLARFEAGLEGSIAKDPTSTYDGKRNEKWVKLKAEVSVDLVPLGAYLTDEQRQNDFACSGLLGGVRNGHQYETLTKIPINNREVAAEMMKKLDLREVRNVEDLFSQSNVVYNPQIKKHKDKIPQWLVRNPRQSLVVEVRGMGISRSKNWHSCGLEEGYGYSVRQPVYSQIREDKTPKTATSTQEIKDMYKIKE